MKNEFDYLIIGQGLAGTILGHFLLKKGASFLIIDDEDIHTSSEIAAGLINPITGRRFVKSWRIDELLPFAKATYKEMEEKLEATLFHQHNIVRALFNAGEENDWLARSAVPGYDAYIHEPADTANILPFVQPSYAYSEIKQSARVDLALMKKKYKKHFQEQGSWTSDSFDHQHLEITNNGIQYKQWKAKKIIFCEGAKVKQNPYFNYLPFKGDKGEVLLVKIPNINLKKIYKHRVYLIPYGEDTYWVGASTQWEYRDTKPSEGGRKELIEKLEKAIDIPYTILDHKAAIRPTVRDRRPFIGQHPKEKNLYLLNGFGTKGTSLAPFWTKHFVDYLMGEDLLSADVSIERYEKYLLK